METEQKPEPVWGVVANIVQEHPFGPGGLETRRGTKHYSAGAKVYCIHFFWDGPRTRVQVTGLHRGSRHYATTIVRHERLTNPRLKLIHSPLIIKQIQDHGIDVGDFRDSLAGIKARAEQQLAWLLSLKTNESGNEVQEETL